MSFELVVGMEVHAQLKTGSKLFCACGTAFASSPNIETCPVCLGYPGVLPVLNRRAVELLCKTALALNCQINKTSVFARKNYFYPDLPKGYQISQYELPLAENGWLYVESGPGKSKKIRIRRIHLEEDTGKLLHESGSGSLLDLNRAGIPLMEIVTEPDIHSSDEAYSYISQLRSIFRYLDVSDGNMEEGNMRCEPNISINKKAEKTLGTKVELKNLNSFRSVVRGIEYEYKRQSNALCNGEELYQETRGWDEKKQKSFVMRRKEDAHDYRYFPEPDLPPLVLSENFVAEQAKSLPELPACRAERFKNDFGLSSYDAGELTRDREIADYFEEVIVFAQKKQKNCKLAANWILNVLLGSVKEAKISLTNYHIRPADLRELLTYLEEGKISSKIAKDIYEKMHKKKQKAGDVIKAEGIIQVSDTSQLLDLVEEVLCNHPGELQKFFSGKERVIAFFVGQVMKATKGKANPGVVNKLLRAAIEKRRPS
ncbi:Asp-tRNA(Asn)/Glu-tRNA(Gln) amidotransferase subunit GatB [Candidatus Riflebacteria bacterium]